MEEILQKLIEILTNTSPAILETLKRQVFIEATSDLVWGLLFFVFSAIMFLYARKDDYNYGKSMKNVIGAFFIFVALIFITISIQMFLNPDYYAIKNIVP